MKKDFTVTLTINVTKCLKTIALWAIIFILGFICFFALSFLDAKNTGTLDAMADYIIKWSALTAAAITGVIALENWLTQKFVTED